MQDKEVAQYGERVDEVSHTPTLGPDLDPFYTPDLTPTADPAPEMNKCPTCYGHSGVVNTTARLR